MSKVEEFDAALDRITQAQGSTKVQLEAVRQLIVALREQVAAGGVISSEDLDRLLEKTTEKAQEAESISDEADAADDE